MGEGGMASGEIHLDIGNFFMEKLGVGHWRSPHPWKCPRNSWNFHSVLG